MKSRAVVWVVVAMILCGLAAITDWDRVANLLAKDANADLGRTVRGVVVDAESGQPIAGARIRCVNTKRMYFSTRTWTDEARSNATGEFAVRGSERGDTDSGIEVTAPGYDGSTELARFGERMQIRLWSRHR